MRNNICLILFVMILTACGVGTPNGVMKPGKMADVLYDYHRAIAAANQDGDQAEYNKQVYYYAALKKNGVTKAEFDSSMVYYQRHAQELVEVYDEVVERLQAEAGDAGGSDDKYANLTAFGDTALIWQGATSAVLMSQAPFNTMTFYLKADTAYKAGDSFEFNFTTQFLFQDGTREVVALMAVTYENDSVASTNMRPSSNSTFSLRIPPAKNDLGIKEIRGFIFMNDVNQTKTTLRMLFVRDISLIRFHKVEKKDKDEKTGSPTMLEPATNGPMRPKTLPIKDSVLKAPVKPGPDTAKINKNNKKIIR